MCNCVYTKQKAINFIFLENNFINEYYWILFKKKTFLNSEAVSNRNVALWDILNVGNIEKQLLPAADTIA